MKIIFLMNDFIKIFSSVFKKVYNYHFRLRCFSILRNLLQIIQRQDRWLSSQEHNCCSSPRLFKFPSPTWWLITSVTLVPGDLMPSSALNGTAHTVVQPYMQRKQSYTKSKNKILSKVKIKMINYFSNLSFRKILATISLDKITVSN